MKDDDMDRILSKTDEIVPSSGFTASVMEAVRRETAAPPPIPFPWKRALPGLVLAALALVLILGGSVVVMVQMSPAAEQSAPSWSSVTQLIPQGAAGSATGWTMLSLLVAFVSVAISMRLAKV